MNCAISPMLHSAVKFRQIHAFAVNEFVKQVCIPVGWVPSAAVAVLGGGCLPRGVSDHGGVCPEGVSAPMHAWMHPREQNDRQL